MSADSNIQLENVTNSMNTHRIAVIAGDGIGQEVMPEGLRVLEAAARRFGIALEFDHFDFGSCAYYVQHGSMLPSDWKAQIESHDAIFFGAVGWPATVPDHISVWGSIRQRGRNPRHQLHRTQIDVLIELTPKS